MRLPLQQKAVSLLLEMGLKQQEGRHRQEVRAGKQGQGQRKGHGQKKGKSKNECKRKAKIFPYFNDRGCNHGSACKMLHGDFGMATLDDKMQANLRRKRRQLPPRRRLMLRRRQLRTLPSEAVWILDLGSGDFLCRKSPLRIGQAEEDQLTATISEHMSWMSMPTQGFLPRSDAQASYPFVGL